MITERIEDRVYFKSNLLNQNKKIVHFFTSKSGGYSKGNITGLNLGFRVNDDYNAVKMNYMQISKDFDIPFEGITAAKQVHSTEIRVITDREKGFGVSREKDLFEADGLVSNCTDIPITVFYADCVPILLADSKAGVVAAVHAGWRGTVNRIAENAVKIMIEEFGANAKNITAAIGPSIGKCCFEIGPEVACEFDKEFLKVLPNNKFKADLWEANKKVLKEAGVCDCNIDVFRLCTVCNSDLLYSYRAHGEKTGRMGATIMLKG